MLEFDLQLVIVPLAILLAGGIYVFFVRPKMLEVAHTIDEHALNVLAKGKTLLLTTVAMASQLLVYFDETAVASLSTVPWANILDEHTANMITTICLLLIPVTHMYSITAAAKAVPKEPE